MIWSTVAAVLPGLIMWLTAEMQLGPDFVEPTRSDSWTAFGSVLQSALMACGSVASWVLPMYLTALSVALAVLVLPNWEERTESSRASASSNFAAVRRAVGTGTFVIGPLFAVWALWIVVGLATPGVSVGNDSAGVLLALPLLTVLTVLVSRAALGTLEQRLEDTKVALDLVVSRRNTVRRLSYSYEPG